MNDISISVDLVSKIYKLYSTTMDRLKEAMSPSKKKYHKEFYALSNVSFNINKGEVVGIIGKNGSGKSTILKIITGIVSPTHGNISVKGKISALLELGAGFNPEYTGLENIYLNGMMLGYTRDEMEQKLNAIMDFAEIGDFIHQPVKSYSSGMFARLAFSVAINVDPDILIVDEALAVGDLRFQLKCMEKFNDFRDKGKTILFVSHDINSIKRYCDRVIWINEGKVEAQGHTETLCDRYTDFLKYGSTTVKENCFNQTESNKILNSDVVGFIEKFTILNDKNQIINDVIHGESIKVKVDYLMNVENLDIVIGVAIHTIDNLYVCGLNTLLDNKVISYIKGKNSLTLEYKHINLLGGTYYFDVAIFERNAHVPIEYKSRVCDFFVQAPYTGEGIYIMPHKWSEEE